MQNLLFILSHLGCLLLLLRESSAGNQRRIRRTAQEKGDFRGFVVFGHQSTQDSSAPSLGREGTNFSSSLAASLSITLKELKNCWGAGREGGVVKSAFLAFCLFKSRVEGFHSSHIPSLAEQAVAASLEALNTELLPSDKVRCAASLNAKFSCTFRMLFFTPRGKR